jgi:phosphatidylserine/phosphatidylglycerophosphate/cardiolipin synthase-like enzyme
MCRILAVLFRGPVLWGLCTVAAVTPAGAGNALTEPVQAQVLGVYFTPPAGPAQAIIAQIDHSEREVLVQAYGFTHRSIAQALARAQQRGVDVRVLVDAKSEAQNHAVLALLEDAQVHLRADGQHAIAHNKLMLIDEAVVITGSFNFTNAAESRNAENLLILQSHELSQVYKQQWERHWAHSRQR